MFTKQQITSFIQRCIRINNTYRNPFAKLGVIDTMHLALLLQVHIFVQTRILKHLFVLTFLAIIDILIFTNRSKQTIHENTRVATPNIRDVDVSVRRKQMIHVVLDVRCHFKNRILQPGLRIVVQICPWEQDR